MQVHAERSLEVHHAQSGHRGCPLEACANLHCRGQSHYLVVEQEECTVAASVMQMLLAMAQPAVLLFPVPRLSVDAEGDELQVSHSPVEHSHRRANFTDR